MDKHRREQLLARKCALTPALVMARPGAPFPWHRVPYLHGILPPHARFAGGALTTDEHGLRHVVVHGRTLGWRDFEALPGPKHLLVGASTAYAMGASDNAHSIASQLTAVTQEPWFHLAVGSYVTTQEFLLYSLMNPHDIQDVVVLSGLNTLSACVAASPAALDDIFSPNFFCAVGGTDGLRGQLQAAWRRWCRRPDRSHRADIDPSLAAERLALAVRLMRRDLELLRDLCQSRGARVTFVLQPLLGALAKPLTAEETEITAIQRELGQRDEFALWGLYCDVLPGLYRAYGAALADVCRSLGLAFADAGDAESPLRDAAWLFADQAHCTDAGYRRCAELIARQVAGAVRCAG